MTKPRKIAINTHITEGQSIEMIWNEHLQRLSIRTIDEGKTVSAKKVELITYYDRAKKPKILNNLAFRKSSEFTLDHTEALKKYNFVWALDTNRKIIFEQWANVSVATACATDGTNTHYPVLGIIFGQTKGNPEMYAWRKFIEFIQHTAEHDTNHRYALIVDSELSLIPQINDRKIPIHREFLLPLNWDIIYATSDSGKESIINQALATSDAAASRILNLIATKPSNLKHWNPVKDEEKHSPSFLPLLNNDCAQDNTPPTH